MNIKSIFSDKVDQLISDYTNSGNKLSFLDKAKSLSLEIREAQKDIPLIAVDQRQAMYKLTDFIKELKGENKNTGGQHISRRDAGLTK